jgi:hypothetical protein
VVPHAHVAVAVEHTLVGENAAGGHEVLDQRGRRGLRRGATHEPERRHQCRTGDHEMPPSNMIHDVLRRWNKR